MELLQVVEAAGVDAGHRVVSEPEVLELHQVVEGLGGNPANHCLLYAKFPSVHREVCRDFVHVQVIT
jgi:hypothetical protein